MGIFNKIHYPGTKLPAALATSAAASTTLVLRRPLVVFQIAVDQQGDHVLPGGNLFPAPCLPACVVGRFLVVSAGTFGANIRLFIAGFFACIGGFGTAFVA